MRWKTIVIIDFIVSLVLALGLMLRGLLSKDILTCGIITLNECGLRQWLIELLITIVALFMIILIIVAIIKSKLSGPGKIKMPKIKKEKPLKIKKQKPIKKAKIEQRRLEKKEQPLKKIKI